MKELSNKNACGKQRDVENPYHIYRALYLPNWEWRVLKKYQSPKGEATNSYARWFCAVKSPCTYGDWEYGDTYISDIKEAGGFEISLAEAKGLEKEDNE